MKLNHVVSFNWQEGETLAVFGAARLVKKPDGRYELHGGATEDRAAARKWTSLFLQPMPDAVFSASAITP